MKFSTTAVIMAAAMGASAHPSAHAHQKAHRSIEQRDGQKFVKYAQPVIKTVTEVVHAKPTGVVNAAEQQKPAYEAPESKPKAPEPQPEPEPASPKYEPPKQTKPKTPSKGNSGSNGKGVTSYTPFCGGKKRATEAEIHYAGNLGTPGDYGCNLMMVANDEVASHYDYKLNMKNVGDKEQTCKCWLKIGSDGKLSTFFEGKELFGFSLPAGSDQWIVGDKNTQGSCSCVEGSKMLYAPMTSEVGGTWAEFDFANTSNDGWSGADASCLTSTRNNMPFPGMRLCAPNSESDCSIIHADGSGSNSFLKGMEAEDGHGINQPSGLPLTLKIEMGYKG